MTVRTPPSWLQAGSHPAEDDRLLLDNLLSQPGVLTLGTGAFAANEDLGVAQHSTPNMSVDVASGAAAIAGSLSAVQGTYHAFNDALLNVLISASDPTNPRIDLIVFKVQDAAYTGATNSASIVAVTGTAAGSPVAPAAPANCIVLAQIAVGAGVTTIVNANITDKRTAGGTRGLVGPLSARPATPLTGQGMYRDSLDSAEGMEYQNSAGSWRLPWNMPWGLVAAVDVQTNSSAFVAATDLASVTFTALARRHYLTTARFTPQSTVAGDSVLMQIVDGSNVQITQKRSPITNAADNWGVDCWARELGISGSQTRKIRVTRNTGSGNITNIASATLPTQIVIMDIGPGGAPQ